MVAVRSVATKAPEVADYAVEERVSSTQGGRGVCDRDVVGPLLRVCGSGGVLGVTGQHGPGGGGLSIAAGRSARQGAGGQGLR
jgi:hypothetical protein